MKTLAIIPARAGSKGIYKKNLLKLGGKPLFEISIDCVKKAGVDYIVSTNDKEIIKICLEKNYSFKERPEELSTDDTPMLAVVKHISSMYLEYDAFIILQPTSPFRKSCDIINAINIMRTEPDKDAVVSITELDHKYCPEKIMQISNKSAIGGLNFNNRQDLLSKYYYRNGLIYLSRRKTLEKGLIIGNVGYIKIKPERALDIDTWFDYELAKCISNVLSI